MKDLVRDRPSAIIRALRPRFQGNAIAIRGVGDTLSPAGCTRWLESILRRRGRFRRIEEPVRSRLPASYTRQDPDREPARAAAVRNRQLERRFDVRAAPNHGLCTHANRVGTIDASRILHATTRRLQLMRALAGGAIVTPICQVTTSKRPRPHMPGQVQARRADHISSEAFRGRHENGFEGSSWEMT